MHIFTEMGRTAIGSRLRRLSEWISDDVGKLYEAYGVHLQPKWFPVLYLLSDKEPRAITAIAELIGQSHPSVSKIARELVSAGLVSESKNARDGRQNLIRISEQGAIEWEKMQPQIKDVRAAIDEMVTQTNHDLLSAIEEWEYLLAEETLQHRTLRQKKERESSGVSIVPYNSAYRQVFHDLNKAWIDQYFTMEPSDDRYLSYPEENIIQPGGEIWVAMDDGEPVGVCALVVLPEDFPYDFELSKMAVDPAVRGKSIGYLLGQTIIERARSRGGKSLFLESNTVLEPAINLYRKLGFRKVAQGASNYDRSNIQMALTL